MGRSSSSTPRQGTLYMLRLCGQTYTYQTVMLHKALASGAGLQQQHRMSPLQGRQRFLAQYPPICIHSSQHSKDMFLETIPARGWQYAGKGREYASSTFSLWKKDSEIRVKGENTTRN